LAGLGARFSFWLVGRIKDRYCLDHDGAKPDLQPEGIVNKPRAVMDTNVLVAAFRSRTGASFEIFQRLRRDEWIAVLSNHLVYEYEEVLKRDAATSSLRLDDVDQILNAMCSRRGMAFDP